MAMGNHELGLVIGGQAPSSAYSAIAQVTDYSQDAVESLGNTLGANRAYAGTLSHVNMGLNFAGSNGSVISTSSKINFTTLAENTSTAWGAALFYLSSGSFQGAGFSMGGLNGSIVDVAAGYKFTWATEAVSALSSALGQARAGYSGQGMQSSTHLYQIGGTTGAGRTTRVTTREKVDGVNDSRTALSALGTNRSSRAALSMPTRGLLVGGLSGAGTTGTSGDVVATVDTTDFSNDAQSTTTSLASDITDATGLSARKLF